MSQKKIYSVLVIDDDIPVLSVLQRVLEKEGYQVTCVNSGKEGLGLLEREDFDLIITDVVLQDICGVDFVHAMEHINPDLFKKLLFITGNVYSDATEAVQEATGAPCLSKPFALNELRQTINKMITAS